VSIAGCVELYGTSEILKFNIYLNHSLDPELSSDKVPTSSDMRADFANASVLAGYPDLPSHTAYVLL